MKEVFIRAHNFRGFSPWLLCSVASEPEELKEKNLVEQRTTGGREKRLGTSKGGPPGKFLLQVIPTSQSPYHLPVMPPNYKSISGLITDESEHS